MREEQAMRKTMWFTAALLAASVNPADAALLLAIDVNGVQACASDNNGGCGFGAVIIDLDPAVGVMSFGNTPISIGRLEITGSVQQATIGGLQNVLNTSSTQLTNTTGAPISGTFAVSATEFTPPVSFASVSGSATWENAVGSSILMQWYNDPSNAQGAQTATDTPGVLLASCADAVTLIADATACSFGPLPISDLDPFSMTLYTQFTIAGGATVVNRGQTIIKEVAADVPEPATMGLLGLSLLGAGIVRRRRQ